MVFQNIMKVKLDLLTLRSLASRRALLITDLTTMDKNYKFFVKPALEQSQISDIDLINLKQDTILKNFIKKNNQIVFNNYKILIIDKQLNYKKLSTEGRFSSVWLTANNKFKLENIPKEMEYKNLIIDATNKDYKITNFNFFTDKNKIIAHILKKNPAYLVYLTQ